MKRIVAIFTIGLAALASGCGDGERVVQVATQAAQRQAKQNEEMARITKEVAEGTKQLVTADAAARKEIITVHKQLQTEREEMNKRLDDIESERKAIAAQRRTESILLPVVTGSALLLAGILVIGFCWSLVFGARGNDDADFVLNELLVTELVEKTGVKQLEGPSQKDALPELPEN